MCKNVDVLHDFAAWDASKELKEIVYVVPKACIILTLTGTCITIHQLVEIFKKL